MPRSYPSTHLLMITMYLDKLGWVHTACSFFFVGVFIVWVLELLVMVYCVWIRVSGFSTAWERLIN